MLGAPKQRLAALDRVADVYVISYDNLKWLLDEIVKRQWSFSVLIADECVETSVAATMRAFTHVVDRAALDIRPPVVEIVHDVPIDEATAEVYAKIDGGMTKAVAIAADHRPITIHEMAVVGKLMQVVSGAVYDDDGRWWRLHDRRLDMLAELHEAHDRSTLVFVTYRHEIERIKARFPLAVELNAERIDAWNAGDIELLVAHPASAGNGVNLQYGSDTLVLFSLPWSAEPYAQANARLVRQGQRHTVSIHVLISRGYVDEIAYRIVHQRLLDQERLIAAVQHS